MWLGYEAGRSPSAIAAGLALATGADPRRVMEDACRALVEWVGHGLLTRLPARRSASGSRGPDAGSGTAPPLHVPTAPDTPAGDGVAASLLAEPVRIGADWLLLVGDRWRRAVRVQLMRDGAHLLVPAVDDPVSISMVAWVRRDDSRPAAIPLDESEGFQRLVGDARAVVRLVDGEAVRSLTAFARRARCVELRVDRELAEKGDDGLREQLAVVVERHQMP
jgi:hypothetical protein